MKNMLIGFNCVVCEGDGGEKNEKFICHENILLKKAFKTFGWL